MQYTANSDELYFLTLTVVKWVDVFTRIEYKDFICEQLNYCVENKGLEIYAYVIMTNHIHLLARSPQKVSLANIIRDFKTYTSKRMIDMIKRNPQESRKEWMLKIFSNRAIVNPNVKTFKFWQDGNRPFPINRHHTLKQKFNYINHNPIRAGFVGEAHHYKYCSANLHGPVRVLPVSSYWL